MNMMMSQSLNLKKRFDNLKEIGLKESMDLLLWLGVVRLIQAAGQANIARELYQPPHPYEVDQLEFPRPEHRVFPYDLSKAAQIFDELIAAKPAQSPVIQRLAGKKFCKLHKMDRHHTKDCVQLTSLNMVWSRRTKRRQASEDWHWTIRWGQHGGGSQLAKKKTIKGKRKWIFLPPARLVLNQEGQRHPS